MSAGVKSPKSNRNNQLFSVFPMQKRQKTLPEPHDHMLGNDNLAIENMPAGQKNGHWDVFPENV